MINVFLKANAPIADIPRALSGLDCERVQVRNGGPTEVWMRSADGWRRDAPGMTLFEDLQPGFVYLEAYRLDGVMSHPVNEGMPLRLEHTQAREWLAAMERHRYALEDAIGCSIDVLHDGQWVTCASALLPLSEFKSLICTKTPLSTLILAWVDRALAAGADQISVSIPKAIQPDGQDFPLWVYSLEEELPRDFDGVFHVGAGEPAELQPEGKFLVDEDVLAIAEALHRAATPTDLAQWSPAYSRWRAAKLDQAHGPVVDEVNLLMQWWYNSGSLEDRAKCQGAIELLGKSLAVARAKLAVEGAQRIAGVLADESGAA